MDLSLKWFIYLMIKLLFLYFLITDIREMEGHLLDSTILITPCIAYISVCHMPNIIHAPSVMILPKSAWNFPVSSDLWYVGKSSSDL